jgi:hypothetical protein
MASTGTRYSRVPQSRPSLHQLLRGACALSAFKRKHGSQASYHCTGKIKVGAD